MLLVHILNETSAICNGKVLKKYLHVKRGQAEFNGELFSKSNSLKRIVIFSNEIISYIVGALSCRLSFAPLDTKTTGDTHIELHGTIKFMYIKRFIDLLRNLTQMEFYV